MIKRLSLFTLILAIAADLLNMLPALKGSEVFTWLSLAFFFLISLVVLYFGEKGIRSKSQRTFTAMINLGTLLRLVGGASLVLIYALLIKPSDKLFVVPFFLFYLCYTVFDVAYLIRLNRKQQADAAGDTKKTDSL